MNNQFDYIDIAVDSLNKFQEELCGDHVEISHNDNSKIIVLSDGLGSGVKANILSTLTSNIASTMLKLGSDIIEVLETLEKTLPTCKVRNLAYSTFTIIQVFNNGELYIIEFDNPRVIYLRDGQIHQLEETILKFKDKTVIESRTNYQKGDLITCFSDGVIHTGIGKYIDLGWQRDEITQVLMNLSKKEKNAKSITKEIIEISNIFSGFEPGDDTTCVVVKIRDIEKVTIFSGPPKDIELDEKVVNDLKHAYGTKIICGGTAANIYARVMNEEIITDIHNLDPEIPPYAWIKGIDLVTEGVITINKTVDIINNYLSDQFDVTIFDKDNGASILADILINKCTHLDIFMGNAVNPAHLNPYFPDDISIKWKSTQNLLEAVKRLGKEVKVIKY